jgi:hypothetical protein
MGTQHGVAESRWDDNGGAVFGSLLEQRLGGAGPICERSRAIGFWHQWSSWRDNNMVQNLANLAGLASNCYACNNYYILTGGGKLRLCALTCFGRVTVFMAQTAKSQYSQFPCLSIHEFRQ